MQPKRNATNIIKCQFFVFSPVATGLDNNSTVRKLFGDSTCQSPTISRSLAYLCLLTLRRFIILLLVLLAFLYFLLIYFKRQMNRGEKYVKFVQLQIFFFIENHACLYDIKPSSYTRQDIKEKAWNEISNFFLSCNNLVLINATRKILNVRIISY